MIPYVSIDIETTGLDPDRDQVLQIAAIIDNGVGNIADLPSFEVIIKHDRIQGSPFALAMNRGLINRIAAGSGVPVQVAVDGLLAFLPRGGSGATRIVAAGKNFAGFDRQFLKRLSPTLESLFHHRSLDPAMMWARRGDLVPPNTEECLRRAGMHHELHHDALEDARDVVHLIRRGWSNFKYL